MTIAISERWLEIEPLIDRLLDVPAAERVEWLRTHCVDADVRALVARALDDAPGVASLERGMAQWLPAFDDGLDDALPVLPGYRVLRFVGAGGMASVFEAQRELPGGPQTVALKLLRLDVHDAEERRGFLREQAILARLQHPHIAQLLDAGFSPTGTPFLALEFVAGDTLVEHCQRRGLGARERLGLFMDVCTAVEHAHRNLIVHRDLKPSNVLVGAQGCIKLVDFGIAKLLTGDAETTRTQARRLTRAYAAPEQFAGEATTTSIDVYALGVLLAELLGGQRPRRAGDLSGATTPVFDGEALRRTLGADLHAIVQEATRPDPLRRYPDVAMLREDIQRHLDGRPLQARADRIGIRVAKFVRRHALAVSAGVGVATVLAASTAIGLHEASLARAAAAQTRAQALAAEDEAHRAQALKSFLEGLFDNATRASATNDTAELLLAQGRERVERDFALQPALHVEILALIGDLERRSGHPDRARQPLEQAAALAKAQFGPTDRRTLHIEYLLAKESDELGRVQQASARLQAAIAAFESGPQRDSPDEISALAWLAGLDERRGQSTSAIALGQRAVALARGAQAAGDALAEAVTNLGWIQMDAGHPALAEPLLREGLTRTRERLGNRHPDVADAMALLADALRQDGRAGESERLLLEAIAIDDQAHAQPNSHTAWHVNDLANTYALQGRFEQAQASYAKALAMNQALAPAGDLARSVNLANLARLRFRQGDVAEAQALLRDAIRRKEQLLGADYKDNGRSYDRACLAQILVARGRLDEAREIVDDVLAEARTRHAEAHPDIAFALAVQARLMSARGDAQRASTLAASAVAMDTALGDARSERTTRARLLSGAILHGLGRDGEARPRLQDALAAADAMAPAAPALVAHLAAELAQVAIALGDRAGAARMRQRAQAALAEVASGPNAERNEVLQLLAPQ
jgi:tetratricopeptide (TPR) repeat protein/tRNA A-37 threonylcarbamoyl transferase component Bud32